MEAWIKKTGYPLVQVSIDRENEGKTVVSFKQSRFLYDFLIDKEPTETLWPIHTSIQSSAGHVYQATFENNSTAVEINDTVDWLKLNFGQTGFYRVAYSDLEWEAIQTAVAGKALPAVDRLGVQNDAYALARSGHLPATIFLSLALAYLDEDDAIVWGDLASNLKSLEGLIGETSTLAMYREFGRKIFSKIASITGWEPNDNETHLQSLLRSIVIGQYGSYGDEPTLEIAIAKFKNHYAGTEIVRPDMRSVVFGLAAQSSDSSTYEKLWDLYTKAELNEEKVRILGALTRVRDPNLIDDLLKRSLSDEVRSQDAPGVIIQLANQAHGLEIAWDFLRSHWTEIDRRYGKGGFAIMRLVSIGSNFSSIDREKEVKDFFEQNPAPSAARTIEQTLESIRPVSYTHLTLPTIYSV